MCLFPDVYQLTMVTITLGNKSPKCKIPRDLKSYYSILSCQHPLCLQSSYFSLPPEVARVLPVTILLSNLQVESPVPLSVWDVSVCLFKFPKVNVASQAAQWWRICLPSRRHMFDPWVRKIPWRRKWIATLVFSLGNFHGQRSLAAGCKESDMTSWLNNKVNAQSRKGKPFIGRKSQYNRTKG